MFSSALTLKNTAGSDVVLNTVAISGNDVRRVDISGSNAEPRAMRISHRTTGKGLNSVDSHLIQLTKVAENDTKSSQATVNLTIISPNDGVVTEDMVQDLLDMLVYFITDHSTHKVDDTVLTAILRGES
jgi:hypothetical protein